MSRVAKGAALALGVAALGFVLAWSFLAYTNPDMVIDFATLLQMCGMPIAK